MGTYVSYCRSSYVKIKKPELWDEFCKRWDCRPITKTVSENTLYGFISNNGLPSRYNEDTDAYCDFDTFVEEVASQLDPDHVLIVEENGHENERYLTGVAISIDSSENINHIDINDIYETIPAGKQFTKCQY